MIASGFGMAALLPCLKQSIHGYQTRKPYTRQIRVGWQVQSIGKWKRYICVDSKLTNVAATE